MKFDFAKSFVESGKKKFMLNQRHLGECCVTPLCSYCSYCSLKLLKKRGVSLKIESSMVSAVSM